MSDPEIVSRSREMIAKCPKIVHIFLIAQTRPFSQERSILSFYPFGSAGNLIVSIIYSSLCSFDIKFKF